MAVNFLANVKRWKPVKIERDVKILFRTKAIMECVNCNGLFSVVYATHQKDPTKCWCSKPCHLAWAKDGVETRLGQCLEAIEKDRDTAEFIRMYKIELVLLRAILKGSSKEQLLKLKKIAMGRYVEVIELASTEGDDMYLRMANATKKMIDNYDCLIEWFHKA